MSGRIFPVEVAAVGRHVRRAPDLAAAASSPARRRKRRERLGKPGILRRAGAQIRRFRRATAALRNDGRDSGRRHPPGAT